MSLAKTLNELKPIFKIYSQDLLAVGFEEFAIGYLVAKGASVVEAYTFMYTEGGSDILTAWEDEMEEDLSLN